MALQELGLRVDQATPSGGARLVAAGGGMPQRITVADDVWLNAVMEGRSGVAWDPDGLHVWVTFQTAQRVKKIKVSDGSVVADYNNNSSDGGTRIVAVPYGCSRRGTKIYFVNGVANANNFIGEIDTQTGVCRLYQQTGYPATALGHVFCAEPGKVWYRTTHTSSAIYREATLSGTGDAAVATDTGRTITGWDGAGDNEGLRAYVATGAGCTWIDLATSVQTPLAAILNGVSGLTGYGNALRGLVWDHVTNSPIHNHGNQTNDHWSRVTRNPSTGALTAWGRRVMGLTDFGGPGFYYTSNFARPAFAISDDGSKLAMVVAERNVANGNLNSIRIVNIGIQRARWTIAPAAGQVWDVFRVCLNGDLANQKSAIEHMPSSPSWLQAVHDFRKTRLWVSTDGGATRFEYKSGDYLGITLVGDLGEALTVDVDFQMTLDNLMGIRPWIGQEAFDPEWSNAGAIVTYEDNEDGAATVYVPTGGGGFRGRLQPMPAFRGRLGIP